VALKQLQAAFVAENYDLPAVIREHLQGSRDAVQSARSEGDPYGLVDTYQADVDYLESIVDRPIPDSAEQRIDMLQRIWASGGEGLGNILDIRGISETDDILTARVLSPDELIDACGTTQPSKDQATKIFGRLADSIDRGQCICFPVYEAETPIGWWFAGYSID
jgi:hypothetical protein